MGARTEPNDAAAWFQQSGLEPRLEQAPANETVGRAELGFEDTAEAPDTVAGSVDDAADTPLVTALRALPLLSIDDADDTADFTVRGVLGEGGMGVVQRVEQRSLGREVAVKRIHPSGASPRSVSALLTEARITGALEHPNIVPIHALGRDPHGAPALVMKRVEGVPWSHLIRDPTHARWAELGDDRLRVHLETLMQVCRAVEFAHSRSVLHRDLKPDNVMIGRFGEVYVLDWGIALALSDAAKGTEMAGTPAYMAPEMAAGSPMSERTDGYLLGAILHEILTGQPPHTGTTLIQAIAHILTGEPPTFEEGTPRELADLCRRALSSVPEARFPTVSAFRKAIAAFLAHKESSALTDGALRRLDELDGTPEARRAALGEIQFVLRQALQVWEANGPASTGLSRANDQLVRLELDAGNLEAAAARIATYDAPDELRAALSKAEEAAERERRRIAKLESVAAEHDIDGFWQMRRRRILTGAAALTFLPVIAWAPVAATGGHVSHAHLAFAGGVLGLLAAAGLITLRRRPDLEMRKKVVIGLAPLLLLTLPFVLVAWRAGLEPGVVVGLLTCMVAAGMFVLAAVVHSVFWVPSGVLIVAGAVGMLFPRQAVTATALGDVVSVLVSVAVLLRRPTREPPPRSPD